MIGTMNVAEAAKDTCPNLQKFILAGSVEEYGNQEHFPITESAELRAMCPYAVAKIAAEKYLKYLWEAYKFPSVIFRQANTYGRKDNDYFIVETIVTQMLRGNEVNLGDPRPVRDLLYVEDLCRIYLDVINNSDPSILGQSFNVGTEKGVSVKELAQKVAMHTRFRGRINWNTKPPRPGEVWKIIVSSKKARTMLKWRPKTELDQGLDLVVDYWKKKLKHIDS